MNAARNTLPKITPRMPHEQTSVQDVDRSGVIGPSVPFWEDLLQSFVFFLDPSNLVTFLILGVCPFVVSFIPFARHCPRTDRAALHRSFLHGDRARHGRR